MFLVLQKEKEQINSVEVFILKQILDKQKFQHEYTFMTKEEIARIREHKNIRYVDEVVPVGSIEFVQTYLQEVHQITNMHPIEVPEVLRYDKYLQRKYSIIEKKQLPKSGYFFTKYVSSLKEFSHIGTTDDLKRDIGHSLKEGMYQLAEVVEFLAEYRVFVLQDEIHGIQFYNGEPTILPNEQDIERLKEMVARYTLDKTRPQAYSIDIGLVKDRGLCIIEIHPFTSLGLYGYESGSLPYCYKFGLDWYLKHNTAITPFDNFHTFKKD